MSPFHDLDRSTLCEVCFSSVPTERTGPSHSGSVDVKKKIAAYAVAAFVTLLAFLFIYPRLAVKRFEPGGSVYHAREDGMDYYVWFEDGRFITVSADEDRCAVDRVVFTVTGRYWNRLAGKLYFRTGSVFSITKVPDGGRPATVILTCESSRGVFFDEDGCVISLDYDEDAGDTSVGEFRFYGDRLYADGMTLEKTEELDPELKRIVEQYLGNTGE